MASNVEAFVSLVRLVVVQVVLGLHMVFWVVVVLKPMKLGVEVMRL
jgi:hypothetical protein